MAFCPLRAVSLCLRLLAGAVAGVDSREGGLQGARARAAPAGHSARGPEPGIQAPCISDFVKSG